MNRERSQNRSILKPLILTVTLFVAIKFPICFSGPHIEEGRDFETYSLVAQGHTPIQDIHWQYGPLPAFLFGNLLRVLPQQLLTLRIASLILWTLCVWVIFKILLLYSSNRIFLVAGTLLASGLFVYPNYTFNHIPASLALLGMLFFMLKAQKSYQYKNILLSFVCLTLVLFSRPVLTGYGALSVWILWAFLTTPKKHRRSLLLHASLIFLSCFIVFLLLCGSGLTLSFFPSPAIILSWYNYPNIHFLLPKTGSLSSLESALKYFRTLMEVVVFYGHFLIWPTIVLTCAYLTKSKRMNAVILCMVLALVSSLDILHYGHPDPTTAQYMISRGQYFFFLTTLSLLLFFLPVFETSKKLSLGSLTIWVSFLAIGAWTQLPWLNSVRILVEGRTNPYGFSRLKGITFSSKNIPLLDAAVYLNSVCNKTDKVGILQYDPLAYLVIECENLFDRDSNAFIRAAWIPLQPNESPYFRTGQIPSGSILDRRLAEEDPDFLFINAFNQRMHLCHRPGWNFKEFDLENNGYRVCWREKS